MLSTSMERRSWALSQNVDGASAPGERRGSGCARGRGAVHPGRAPVRWIRTGCESLPWTDGRIGQRGRSGKGAGIGAGAGERRSRGTGPGADRGEAANDSGASGPHQASTS